LGWVGDGLGRVNGSAVYKAAHTEEGVKMPARLAEIVRPLRDGQVIGVEGATVQAIETPGHCSDHISFLLREERSLFVGDCVLGVGSSVFSDLFLYERSLRHLRDLIPARIYCGHGPCIGPLVEGAEPWADARLVEEDGERRPVEAGTAKIVEYLSHRRKREDQVLRAWESVGGRASARALADIIYTPEGVRGELLLGAANNVLHTVRKLAREARALPLPPDTAASESGGREGSAGSAGSAGTAEPSEPSEPSEPYLATILSSTIDTVWLLRST
jgi:glyoxylase-like metal-dependent hydrolase (beta-lactamase superfamily II)